VGNGYAIQTRTFTGEAAVPFFKLSGAREALPAKAEQYKALVREYLRSRGFRPDVDSAIEGSFEDLIVVDAGGVNLCVECKDSRISVNEADFVVPLCRLLNKYMRAPTGHPFRAAIFARTFAHEPDVKSLFEGQDRAAIERYRDRCGRVVDVFHQSHPNTPITNPRDVGAEKWAEFLSCCEVFSADINSLEQAIRARGLQVAPWETAAVLVGPRNVPALLEALSDPSPAEEQLVANFFPVVSIPDLIKVRMASPEATPSIRKGSGHFYFDQDAGGTQGPLDASMIQLGTIQTSEWLEDDDAINWLVELLNEHLLANLAKRGLPHLEGTTLYFFAADPASELTTVTVRTPRGKRPWRVVRRYRTEGGATTFFAHCGARIRFTRVGQSPLLTIHPTWMFTEDGQHPVAAARRSALLRRWSRFDRNENRVQRVFSWFSWLSEGQRLLRLATLSDPIVVDSMVDLPRLPVGIPNDQRPLDRILGGEPDIPPAKDIAAEREPEPFDAGGSGTREEED
jgi:hypothetical protein